MWELKNEVMVSLQQIMNDGNLQQIVLNIFLMLNVLRTRDTSHMLLWSEILPYISFTYYSVWALHFTIIWWEIYRLWNEQIDMDLSITGKKLCIPSIISFICCPCSSPKVIQVYCIKNSTRYDGDMRSKRIRGRLTDMDLLMKVSKFEKNEV